MPTHCRADSLDFGSVEGRSIVAAFDGGEITSDGGALLLADSDDVGRGFRLKPATYSDRSRPPIPGMSATPPGWCSRVDAVDTIWR